MNFETYFFFFFSLIVLTSAIFVIYSTNTIYSIFFLVLVFISSTSLLLLSEIEFISIMLILIYVGAITVLFLFVVMMLDINILKKPLKNQNIGYLPIILLINLTFFLETIIVFSKTFTTYQNQVIKSFYTLNNNFISKYFYLPSDISTNISYSFHFLGSDVITNIETIGQILYTYYSVFFLIAGLILLIALIGAVTLTKKELKKKKRINLLYKQISRNSLNAIFTTKYKTKKQS